MTEEKFFKIRINSIHPTKPTTFDIYLYINNHHTLYLRAGDQLTIEKIQNLAKKNADIFYAPLSQKKAYKEFIHSQITSSTLETSTKAKILRESSMTLVEELFENPDVNAALEESKEIITDFVELIDAAPESIAHLIGLSGHDFYTYNHSLDVSIYSLGLGSIVGFKKNDLVDLGQGALLHDIGKRKVNIDIICKRGPLNESEWAEMQSHPHFGIQIMSEKGYISPQVKACCFEHHESWSGNGYPQQLQSEEIHPMARVVAISDTYDALTTQRSYNVPMLPEQALTLMKEKLAGRFDPEFLKAMYSVLFHVK